jgi:hypothetical protein
MDGQQVLEREFPNVDSICLQDGMQKVRGFESLSFTPDAPPGSGDSCPLARTLLRHCCEGLALGDGAIADFVAVLDEVAFHMSGRTCPAYGK